MKKLVICEKPSLARNVADAVSRREKVQRVNVGSEMYYFAGSEYIITFCFGHLFGLGEPESYLNEGEQAVLPFIPSFRLFPTDKNSARQYGLIKKLIDLPEIDGIIHCGDADREGEIIVRNVLRVAKNTKPVYRLWLPEQTETSILKALANLESDSKFDDLANAGYSRTFIDWLFGYNLSRYLMRKAGVRKGWGVGRVMIPIVDAVYKRELDIKNFVSTPYWQLHGEFVKDGIKLTLTDREKYNDRSDAVQRSGELSAGKFRVSSVETKKAVVTPPKMFSLDTLQGKLSKDFGLTLDKSMPIIQSLYEKKFITYPRADTEYFAEEEKGDVFLLADKINEIYHTDLEHKDSKKIFDSSKVESHSAIRPTTHFPTGGSELSDDEKRVYSVIFKRFCAVFAPPCTVYRTTVTITDGSHEYKLKGDTPITAGFRRYEPKKSEENSDDSTPVLPSFSQGELLQITWIIDSKMTKAPPRYTIDSLNTYLKAPFAKAETVNGDDSEADDSELYNAVKKGMEIGSVATRTGIITKTVKQYGYLEIKKNQYYCTDKGAAFIGYLHQLNIDLFLERNVEFNMMLKSVELGTTSMQETIDRTADELRKIISQDVEISSAARFESDDSLGKCPFCGSEVRDGKKNYYCAGYKSGCKFVIFKSSYCKFSFVKDGKVIEYSKPFSVTKANAKALLNGGKTTVSIEEKSGKGKYKVGVTFKPDNKHEFVGIERIPEKKKGG